MATEADSMLSLPPVGELPAEIAERFGVGAMMRDTVQQIDTSPLGDKFVGEVVLTPNAVEDLLGWLVSQLGDLALTYLHKGSRVHIEGTVQLREYKDTGGITKTAIDIVCRDFMMLDSRPAATREDSDGNAVADEPLPF